MSNRLAELWAGLTAKDAVFFTGKKRHLPSVLVRGDQMAQELGGYCVRHRYLRRRAIKDSRAVLWIIDSDQDAVDRIKPLTPQIFEPVNPRVDDTGEFFRTVAQFNYFLLNTKSAEQWLGESMEGRQTWVIPHHHCNLQEYLLPEERLERPMVVGYVGEPVHLHDTEVIQRAVEKAGMRFLSASPFELDSYQKIDIGIAWTRREKLRDSTRSNVKLTNFQSHGIPAVVCEYESYRDADRKLGGDTCVIAETIEEFIDGLNRVIGDEALRRNLHRRSLPAADIYSRAKIAEQYRRMFDEVNKAFRAQ